MLKAATLYTTLLLFGPIAATEENLNVANILEGTDGSTGQELRGGLFVTTSDVTNILHIEKDVASLSSGEIDEIELIYRNSLSQEEDAESM